MHPLHPVLLLGCREGLGKSSCGSCDSLDHVLWEWRFGRSLPTLWKMRLEKLQESSLPGEAVPLGRHLPADPTLHPQRPAGLRDQLQSGGARSQQGGAAAQWGSRVGAATSAAARPDSDCQGKGKLQNKKSLTPSPAPAQRPPTPGEGPQRTARPGARARTQSLSAEGRSPEVQ